MFRHLTPISFLRWAFRTTLHRRHPTTMFSPGSAHCIRPFLLPTRPPPSTHTMQVALHSRTFSPSICYTSFPVPPPQPQPGCSLFCSPLPYPRLRSRHSSEYGGERGAVLFVFTDHFFVLRIIRQIKRHNGDRQQGRYNWRRKRDMKTTETERTQRHGGIADLQKMAVAEWLQSFNSVRGPMERLGII